MHDEKLSGRIIIDTILLNMRQQVEELRYSKIVPAAYDVYLHADDQQRFESLSHAIAAEAVRALQERLDVLNRGSRLDSVRALIGRPRIPYKKVGPWLVRITRDPDGAVPRGRALVVSQIALAGSEAFEGQRTRRLATLSEAELPATVAAAGTASPIPDLPRTPESASSRIATAEPVLQTVVTTAEAVAVATLTWQDDLGAHVARMTGPELTIGRMTQDSVADVKLVTIPDVSRLHIRIRQDASRGSFWIEDLSLLGTTVNGAYLPRATPQELPSPAEIGLADAVTIHFASGNHS